MKNLYIEVEGDVNDGDYISERTDISHLSKQEVNKLVDDLNSLDLEEGYNDELSEYLPFMDNQDLHTITEVTLMIISIIDPKDVK